MGRRFHHPRPGRSFLGPTTLLLLSCLAGTVEASTHNSSNNGASTTFTLGLLHMNDHHSFLDEDSFAVPVANVTGGLLPGAAAGEEEITVYYGGFPRIQSVLLQAEQEYGESLVKLHAGDALVGSVLYSLFRGEADAAMMRLLCFDAFALGNHEFDDGDAQLAEFIRMLRADPEVCNTQVLSANLVPHAASPLQALQNSGDLLGSTVLDVAGESVGVVGINIRNKTLESSSPDVGTTYLDEIATARAQVAALTASGINKIILLTHIGYENDIQWMVEVPGVDIVVGGDSHSLLLGDDDAKQLPYLGTSVGPYPTKVIAATDGRLVCILQAWEFSHIIGLAEIVFDSNGNVLSCDGTPIVPFDPERFEPPLVDPTPIVQHLEFFAPFFSFAENTTARTLLNTFEDQVDAELQTVICEVKGGDICYERIPGQGRSTLCPVEDSAAQGGGACNLVAQAFLDQTPTADVAIQNAGGCRTDIAEGPFTLEDAYELLPFANTLVTLEMTGFEIALVLNQALVTATAGSSTGAYPYAAGLRYDVDVNQPPGAQVKGIDVNIRLQPDSWTPLLPTRTYRVVTNSFIAEGRDGYLAFAQVAKDHVVITYTEYATVFIDYCLEQEIIRNPSSDTFSTKSFAAAIATTADVEPNPPAVSSATRCKKRR